MTLEQQYSDPNQEETIKEDFQKRLAAIVAHGHMSLVIALGVELNLFEALAEAGSSKKPANVIDVARIANVKERYCQEWLCCMACGDIIATDPTGQQFWIPDERVSLLSGSGREKLLMASAMLPMLGGAFKDVAQAVVQEGPLGVDYPVYKEFCARMNAYSIARHGEHLVKDLIPLMNMYDSLHNGIEVLDVGCGAGFHILELASHFPKSNFVGVDIGRDAIRQAQHEVNKKHLENAKFIVADAGKLDTTWTDKFDLVTIFDACHDQTRPDLALLEIHRCLKPGGLFAMVEIDGTGNCFKDKAKYGPEGSAFLYATSLFHCLPVGSTSKDALKLGTMWGVVKGKRLLESSGFQNVTIDPIPFFDYNVLYKATK